MTGKIIIGSLIIAVIITLIYLRKKRKRSIIVKNFCCLADSDYKKIKELPAVKCMECGGCQIKDNKCCDNCSANQQYITDKHCHKHDHQHHHHHHNFNVSKELIIFPLVIVMIIIWGVKKIWK